MTRPAPLRPASSSLRRFAREETGTTLVEFAVVMPIFLLILFGLIDFGRLGFEYVMANKAVQMAARIAVTRPAACGGVPEINTRGPVVAGSVPPYFGTNCRAGANVCADPGTVSCNGSANNPTVAEIWGAVSSLMPSGSGPANLKFTYAFNPDLGFLGGPYTPMVTVEIRALNFNFVTPLDGLAKLGGATGTLPSALTFPALSVSLPAEDLAQGGSG